MAQRRRRYSLRYLLLAAWIIFTLSLACWWVVFGLEQIHRLMAAGYGRTDDLVRYQRMLILEGGALLVSLLAGGATLAYYMYRELKQGERLTNFFLAFTHDAKTALAAVQLQAELLQERLASPADKDLATRLLTELERLTLQLENALYAGEERKTAHLQRIALPETLDQLRARFPQMQITLTKPAVVVADPSALESIFANVLQNAALHGRARSVTIAPEPAGKDAVRLVVTDDGAGFRGERKRLGERFFRHYSGSGTGLGLYLIRILARAMQGEVEFPASEKGFQVVVTLRGAVQ